MSRVAILEAGTMRNGSAYYERRAAREERRRLERKERMTRVAETAYAIAFVALMILAFGFAGGIERGTIHILGI